MKRVGRPAGSRITSPAHIGPGPLWTALLVIVSIPALASVYMLFLRSHPRALRLAVLALLLAAAGSLAVFRLVPQTEGHRPAPVDTQAVARLATPLVAGVAGDQAIDLSFSAPMDQGSVQAALTVTPGTGVRLNWSAGGTVLSILPVGAWAPGTFYTISVGSSARTAAGSTLVSPARAVFLTEDAPTATITAVDMTGKRASPSAGFRVTFSRPVDLASLRSGFRITPAAPGQLTTGLQRGDPTVVTFVPATPLAADTTYVVTFSAPVLASDGMAVSAVPRLVVRTLAQPAIVRTRPAGHAQGVAADASVSVRFDRSMDRAKTQAAFRLLADPAGTRVPGTFSWVENDTVLVFNPSRALSAGHVYTLTVASSATAVDGTRVSLPGGTASLRASFRVASPPAPAQKLTASPSPTTTPAPRPAPTPAPTPTPTPAPSVSGTAPWLSVERYALQLLNCTRTGGWVRSDGSCDGYGSGRYSPYVAPLSLSAGISTDVSRPYAKYQAVRDACSHFLDGTPGDRLARAGYTSYRWAENIGCQTGDPRQVAINSLTFFQSEKSYDGGHWVNLKNPEYSTVGIGVWDYNGYVLVVFDFYHP